MSVAPRDPSRAAGRSLVRMAPLLAAVTVPVNDPGTDPVWRPRWGPSDPPTVSRANADRWRARLTRTRNPARIRFTREGVHLANNVLVPWTDTAARLPKLPEVLTCIRDCDLAWWLHGCHSADVATLYEALDARGLVPAASAERAWWQSCPASGTPLCDAKRDGCTYCRGAGFIARAMPSSAWEVVSLCVHGDRVTRAERFADGVAQASGVPFLRVVWAVHSAHGLAEYHRACYARALNARALGHDVASAFAREERIAAQVRSGEEEFIGPWPEESPYGALPATEEAHWAWPALRGIALLGLHLLDRPKPAGVVLAAPYL